MPTNRGRHRGRVDWSALPYSSEPAIKHNIRLQKLFAKAKMADYKAVFFAGLK